MTLKEMIENFKKKIESNPHYQELLKKAQENKKDDK